MMVPVGSVKVCPWQIRAEVVTTLKESMATVRESLKVHPPRLISTQYTPAVLMLNVLAVLLFCHL